MHENSTPMLSLDFQNPLALAQANHILLRNLLKYLYISGKFQDGELTDLLRGSVEAAKDASDVEAMLVLTHVWQSLTKGENL
jgi:hypothetical protein